MGRRWETRASEGWATIPSASRGGSRGGGLVPRDGAEQFGAGGVDRGGGNGVADRTGEGVEFGEGDAGLEEAPDAVEGPELALRTGLGKLLDVELVEQPGDPAVDVTWDKTRPRRRVRCGASSYGAEPSK